MKNSTNRLGVPNPVNQYYLMRHGESIANQQGIIVCSPQNALSGFGLTATGVRQVIDCAESTRLPSDLIIVSSDYLRTRETAELIRDHIAAKVPIEFDPGLRERDFGELELGDHVHYNTVWNNDLENPHDCINGVESISQVLGRVSAVLSQLERQYRDKSILLVSHGDVLQILLASYRGMDARLHRCMPALQNAEIRTLLTTRSGTDSQVSLVLKQHPTCQEP